MVSATTEHDPDDRPPAEDGSLVGRRLGAFRLTEKIGAGAMGVVYAAVDESLGRRVAVKVLRGQFGRSAAAMVRFRREAQALARVRVPGVARVYEVGEADGVMYLAMDLVPGRGLEQHIRDAGDAGEAGQADGRLPVGDVLRWGQQLAEALGAAHAAGVTHRDVKPSNVRITPDGDAVLLDFGLARGEGDLTLTRTGQFQGTPSYASPEQIAGAPRDGHGRRRSRGRR